MRHLVTWAGVLSIVTAGLIGCGGSNPTVANNPAEGAQTLSPPLYNFTPGGESFVAQFHVAIDPGTLAATVTPVLARQGVAQPPQAIGYDLDIANFLKADSFQVAGVTFDGDGDLTLRVINRHPFPAPDFAGNITGTNRADLGYTGRLLVLADGATTSYFSGSVTTDSSSVKSPDGFFSPGDLLAQTGLTNNTFPYVLLVDDGENSRIGDDNGGNPKGNYDAPNGGWQRSNIGSGTGWTGYDYMHGGQASENELTLYADALSAANFQFDVAVLIKYTDPRGAGGKTLRFPPVATNPTQFAYRLPYATLDCSKIGIDSPVSVSPNQSATGAGAFSVRDWDKNAAMAATSDISGETNVNLIEPGAAGEATVTVSAPFLSTTPENALPSGAATGEPGDETPFAVTLTNALGTAAPGDYVALIKVVDPSDATDESTYHFGVDPITIAPSAARATRRVTYQALPVSVVNLNPAPIVDSVDPLLGLHDEVVQFSAMTSAGVPTAWSWDFGGGATPNTSTSATPTVTLSSTPGTYSCTVQASNIGGSSPVFNWDLEVLPDIWNPGPGPIDPGGGGCTGRGWLTAIDLYDGKPVIGSFEFCGSTAGLRMAFANVANPQGPADWTLYSITLPGATFNSPLLDTNIDLEVIAGRIYVFFKNEATGVLMCAASNVVAPAVPGAPDWTLHVIDPTPVSGRDPKAVVHNGMLALSYWNQTPDDLYIAMANVPVPTMTSHWNRYSIDGAGGQATGVWTGLVSFDDGVSPRLFASARMFVSPNRCRVARALNLTPTSAADWVVMDVEPNSASGRWTSITQCTISGQPRVAVSYNDFATSAVDIAISTSATPSTSGDWLIINNINPVPNFSPGPWGTDIKASASGRLIVVWNNNISPFDTLEVAYANNDNPLTAADFTVENVDSEASESVGFYPRMILLTNGNLAVTYRRGENFLGFPGDLKYASRSIPIP